MFGPNKEVSATCRKCGRTAPASSFILDVEYKMMICPQCLKERRTKEQVYKELKEEKETETQEPQKPVGWDKEDEYLERAFKQKEKQNKHYQRVGDGKINYSCLKCKYKFIYDEDNKHPRTCPYCGTEIFVYRYK